MFNVGMSARAPKTLKLLCLLQLRCESSRLQRDGPIDLRRSPARFQPLAGATTSWRDPVRERGSAGRSCGRGAGRGGRGPGAGRAPQTGCSGELSVSGSGRERKCWLPEEREPCGPRSVRQHILRAPRPPRPQPPGAARAPLPLLGAAAALGEPEPPLPSASR